MNEDSYFLLKIGICQCHVSFQKCICKDPGGFVGPIPPLGPTSSEKPSEGTWRNGYPKLMGFSFKTVSVGFKRGYVISKKVFVGFKCGYAISMLNFGVKKTIIQPFEKLPFQKDFFLSTPTTIDISSFSGERTLVKQHSWLENTPFEDLFPFNNAHVPNGSSPPGNQHIP